MEWKIDPKPSKWAKDPLARGRERSKNGVNVPTNNIVIESSKTLLSEPFLEAFHAISFYCTFPSSFSCLISMEKIDKGRINKAIMCRNWKWVRFARSGLWAITERGNTFVNIYQELRLGRERNSCKTGKESSESHSHSRWHAWKWNVSLFAVIKRFPPPPYA